MAPAAVVMEEALAAAKLGDAAVPAASHSCRRDKRRKIAKNLVIQVTARAWRESLIAMSNAGAKKFVELGTGKVLSGLVKRGLGPKQLSIWMGRMIGQRLSSDVVSTGIIVLVAPSRAFLAKVGYV